MSVINNKYLTVGYQKRHLVPITPMLNRKVMGRKGIGKLSLLSIAETITIYSSKNGQKNALQISTQKLREAVSQTQTYYPEEVDDSGIDFEGNGTKIVLTNLKKSRTTALAGKLKQRLARRFAVIGADKQFEVKVNGEPITISDRNYLTKAQYLWYYLRPADEDIPAQPADEYTKQCKSGVLRKSFSRSGELSIAGKPAYVYGWIATAPKPGDLDDDENINRIAIMVRGKMAKDDMLNEIGTTALYSKYMKEVVHGDDLEKVIQRHLANNLWLLDPAWDRDTKLPSVEEAIKTQFDVINAGLTREEQEARLDVRYQKPSGKHVIIELKRGDRTVKFIELIAQVDKYFSALTKILKKHDTDEDFEIIVLLGKRLDGEKVDHDIESKHLRQLAEVNTRILYYDQLLANAETLYADFIAKNSSLASLETLINSIG